jgi:hypothetical protein
VLGIDISNFLILLSQLHIVIVEFVVVDDFVDLLDPFIVHEHLVVAVGDGLFAGDELLVLGLQFVAQGIDVRFLVQASC